ncbi:MAG TPA: transketolase C-terminal domain-containing protein [Naasia sp.]|jgi:transketolase
MRAQREVWGETLALLGESDPTLVVVDGDLANSTKADLFARRFPERFVEVGIAEQNMVGIAFGLWTLGYRPWLSTFGVFLTHRALDPIRMLVSQTGASVRLAGSYSGLLNGSSGKTHQDVEDLAIMRAMPHMTVIAPADDIEAEAVTRWASDHEGPVYVRFARDAVGRVFPEGYEFIPGRTLVLRTGAEVALVSTGVQTSRVLEAAEALARQGVDAAVIHVPTLKPLDAESLLDSLGEHSTVITVEEHSVLGGLGGAVSEVVAERRPGMTVHRIGLLDEWSESGPNAFLLDKYGLSSMRVAEQVVDLLGTAGATAP